MNDPTQTEIQRRWSWDPGFPATPENIALAIRRTGNSFGITVAGRPYLAPFVGMRVHTRLRNSPHSNRGDGTIIEVRKPLEPDGDPEVAIKTDDGRTVYLFQTALNGYTPAP